jgi:multiple sugar transport system ATP-binding protein
VARVDFDEVTKDFGDDVRAVDRLDLAIADEEFMVLVGPSGCGKTTALRMTAGLEAISEGAISIDGRVVNDVPSAKRDIAMVFQTYALYPHMTVFENMAFGLQQHRMSRREVEQRVREIARLLELEQYLTRKPRALSGGQRQRVAMGRAIVRRPSVFLMDEPLSNLDAKLRVQMRAEIRTLQRELGVTTIYVTHDQVEAMTMGDRVAVLRKGKLQQVAPPHELYFNPANIFVAGFIGSPAMNLLQSSVKDNAIELGGVTIDIECATGVSEGQQLAVGIRPEDLTLGGADGMPARVRYLEDLGAEVIAHLDSDAVPIATDEVREIVAETDDVSFRHLTADSRRGLARIVVRFPAGTRLVVGDEVRLTFTTNRLHLFDLETGIAISRGGGGETSRDLPPVPLPRPAAGSPEYMSASNIQTPPVERF